MERDHDSDLPDHLLPHALSIEQLKQVGHRFSQQGWCRGFGGSFSLVVQREPMQMLITSNKSDKARLTAQDFVLIDAAGQPIRDGLCPLPSKTVLHCLAAELDLGQAILHTSSLWSTILSVRLASLGGVLIEGYEMLKGLTGVDSHEHAEWLPIFRNDRDVLTLAGQVRDCLTSARQPLHGFIIQQSGILTWGRDLDEAVRHVEVLEFLLEAIARQAAK